MLDRSLNKIRPKRVMSITLGDVRLLIGERRRFTRLTMRGQEIDGGFESLGA